MRRSQKIVAGVSAVALLSVAASVLYTLRPMPGLDNFAAITRQDPLFYSPHFDREAFKAAVDELTSSEDNLKKTVLHNMSLSNEAYAKTYAKIIQESPLFPTGFLELLPEISEATEDFTSDPTSRKARHLISLYEQAQQAYEKDSKLMTESFASIDEYIPDNRPVYYFFIQSGTSVALAHKNFDLIHKNSIALKEEIRRRKDCLSGNGGCEMHAQLDRSIADGFGERVAAVGTNVEIIRDTLPYASSSREVRGPYTVESSCWGTSAPQPMYAIYSTDERGHELILPKLAQENYYNLVAPQATDVISTKIREMGLRFYGQAEGTTYECSDLSFYPDILAQDFINRSQPEDKEGTEYRQFLHNKFGVLAPALQSLASFTNLLETSQRISTDFVLSPQFLFTTRSAYSLTYLPFAQSVWRIDEQPQFLLTQEQFNKLGAPKQFKSLTELKKEGYTEEDIRKSQINQKEFIESLVR